MEEGVESSTGSGLAWIGRLGKITGGIGKTSMPPVFPMGQLLNLIVTIITFLGGLRTGPGSCG